MNKETMTETHRNKWPQSVSIGEDDNQLAINLEISQDRFMSIAQEAHRRGVTLNKMVNIMLKGFLDHKELKTLLDDDKSQETKSKPELLNEDK